ncbi:MAG TPA: AMP-binding protein, partial [Syntrophomonadaceae bacterium]|nr:AMP-binding protein [Syntrophomonadaceae bacterium]
MYRKWYDYYSPGVPTTISHPFKPQKDYFLHWAEVQPEKPYLIHGDRVVSYEETNTQARRLANALIQLGCRKQDRIAIIGPNIPEFVIAEQTCFKLGAIIVPLNPYYTIHELKAKLKDSGTSIVIVTSASAGKIIDIMREGQTNIRHIVVIEPENDGIAINPDEHIYNYKTLIENSADTEPSIEILPDDICILIYTGGTTGISKGVPLSVYNIERMSWVTWYWYKVPLRPTNETFRSLVALPLYHIYGFNSQVSLNLVDGGTLILIDSPKTDKLLEAINRFRPNVFFAVPAMIHDLINHPDTPQSAIRTCLKGVNCGGSALAHETLQEWEKLTGLSIVEGYGMTETNIISENPYGHTRQGTVGIPVPDTDVHIVDIKTGTKILGPG